MKKRKGSKKSSALPKKARLNRRLFFVGISMCALLAGLGVKVGKITLLEHEEYTQGTLDNMIKSESVIEAPRGTIQDSKGRQLAISLLTYNIILDPYSLVNNVNKEKYDTLYGQLEAATGQPAHEIRQLVEQKNAERPEARWLELAKKIELEPEQVEALNELEGVTAVSTYKRNYPNGELAAQVLGFYNAEGIGQYGIEEAYDDYLTGQSGRAYAQVHKSKIMISERQSPKKGATVQLTIDSIVQQYVEETMQKYVKEFNPTKASCIIMNPNSGEILAMYSYPSFNPNNYNNLSEQLGSNVWSKMKTEQQNAALLNAWRNNSIQYNYEPGSTFKPLVVAAALQEGIIKVTDTYECSGSKQVADDTVIHCWKTSGHGHQTLSEALANSCNMAMINISEKLDEKTFMNYFKDYGFGNTTGIELAGEESGILHSFMNSVEKATSAIGQTFMVTPIQLITAFSSIINGGYLMEPYVVSEVTSEDGTTLLKHSNVTRRSVLSTSIADKVKNDLKKVVDEEGTGKDANIPGYLIGGKTGTGQKFIEGTNKRVEDLYAASFMGFAPIDHPEVVALVVLDDVPEHTGAPANAFKEMMTNIFPYLEIETSTEAEVDEEKVAVVPEVSGKNIYEAIDLLQTHGFNYSILGNGTQVEDQYPPAQSDWGKDRNVTLITTTTSPGDLVEVPELVGKTVEEAKEMVKGNFTIQSNSAGTIKTQVPKAGTKIEKNQKVIVKTTE